MVHYVFNAPLNMAVLPTALLPLVLGLGERNILLLTFVSGIIHNCLYGMVSKFPHWGLVGIPASTSHGAMSKPMRPDRLWGPALGLISMEFVYHYTKNKAASCIHVSLYFKLVRDCNNALSWDPETNMQSTKCSAWSPRGVIDGIYACSSLDRSSDLEEPLINGETVEWNEIE